MAKLSIVVPVYGVENYLEKCVDSLRKQTLEDIEIILVDDGSKDRCPEMCDDFAKKDSRIKVIHKLNGGISDARNEGVQAATTPYIIFIDSDDEAKPTMCEVLYRHITDKDVDIVTALVDEVKDGQIVGDQSSFEERRISGEEALFDLLSGNGITMYAYSKIYKKHLLDDIKYPKGKIYEDAFTTPYLIASCRQVYVISDRLVNYVRRNDSITLSKFSLKDFPELYIHTESFNEKSKHKVTEAAKAYNVWDPEKGFYAIGYHSVLGEFKNYLTFPDMYFISKNR